jgi:hypothetical protein
MKKYTNKILVATGVAFIVLTSFLVVIEYGIQKNLGNILTWDDFQKAIETQGTYETQIGKIEVEVEKNTSVVEGEGDIE